MSVHNYQILERLNEQIHIDITAAILNCKLHDYLWGPVSYFYSIYLIGKIIKIVYGALRLKQEWALYFDISLR